MPHNRSPRIERPLVLARPLSTYAGHALVADCGTRSCGGARTLWVTPLLPRWGDLSVGQVVASLHCPTCGNRAARVELRRTAVEGRIGRADLVLVLHGPGAA